MSVLVPATHFITVGLPVGHVGRGDISDYLLVKWTRASTQKAGAAGASLRVLCLPGSGRPGAPRWTAWKDALSLTWTSSQRAPREVSCASLGLSPRVRALSAEPGNSPAGSSPGPGRNRGSGPWAALGEEAASAAWDGWDGNAHRWSTLTFIESTQVCSLIECKDSVWFRPWQGSAIVLRLAGLIAIISGKALDRLQGEGQGCMGTGCQRSPRAGRLPVNGAETNC